jgi:NAD(P)-dependent dehydrogenase (short-subunit alcohol dehydrogenase family)
VRLGKEVKARISEASRLAYKYRCRRRALILARAEAERTLATIEASVEKHSSSRETSPGIRSGEALRRVGEPEDIAAAAVLFCSDDARWITGQCIRVLGQTDVTAGR